MAIIRLEQLHPLRRERLEAALSAYREGTPVFWVQEEPANMGPWVYVRIHFGEALARRFRFGGITRAASASPAGGSPKRHKQEQTEIIERAYSQ